MLPSPFFPGILVSRKTPETQRNGRFSKRTMLGKNGESTLRKVLILLGASSTWIERFLVLFRR